MNPCIAVLLGVGFAHEQIRWTTVLAMAVILSGVALVAVKPRVEVRTLAKATSLECDERC